MSAVAELNNHHKNREEQLRELTKTFVGLEKPLKNAKTFHSLKDLISELHKVFESDHINIEYVNHIMLSYTSKPSDWKKYAKFDRYKYTRNLVDEGNGKFNLLLLCWGEGHASAIHDHSNSHCFMKMLQGELAEIRYAWPVNLDPNGTKLDTTASLNCTDSNIMDCEENEYNHEELKEISRSTLETNGVCYINDNLGLHRVENQSNTDCAVSLHLYCPPFDSCRVFNKKTGQQSRCQVTFWSKYGEKI